MHYFYLITLLLVNHFAWASNNDDHCGTMTYLEQQLNKNPELINVQRDIENHTQLYVQNNNNQRQLEVITIPVVVHVLYSNTVSNISDEQVFSQIEALNADYRKTNNDIGLLINDFTDIAADTEVEFCLAARTPDNLPTNGINRVATTISNANLSSDNVKFTSMGGVDAWPTNQYLNIWVCNNIEGGGVLGYAQFPGMGSNATDGVVIDHDYFGTMGTVDFPYNLGRTATHEIGHWLNLRHIWGDGGCNVDDFVEDTPRANNPHYGCASLSVPPNSCTDSPIDYPDMFQNYMDYSDDDCLVAFTEGQKVRVRSVLASGGFREALTSSPACLPLINGANNVGIANIIEPAGPANCTSIVPQIEITNFGTETIVFLVIEYAMGNEPSQMINWTGSLESLASEIIELPIVNSVGTSPIQTFNITISSPNGFDDENPDDNTESITFSTIAGGNSLPIVYGFEDADFPNNDWTINNPDGAIGFELSNEVGNESTYAAFINNFDYDSSGAVDEFAVSDVHVEGSNPMLQFDLAYALTNQVDLANNFEVQVSTDCGASYTPIYLISNENLISATPSTTPFIPTNSNEWKAHSVSLAAYTGIKNLSIKFKQTYLGGNNLYVDNININNGPTGIDLLPTFTSELQLYPNPANQFTTMMVQATQNNTAVLEVLNPLGQTIISRKETVRTGNNSFNIPTNRLMPGLYIVTLNNGQQMISRKLIVSH